MDVIHPSGMVQPVRPGNSLRFLGKLIHFLPYLCAKDNLQYDQTVQYSGSGKNITFGIRG